MTHPYKDVLVAMVGRSPAVVTEALWALHFLREPPVVPEAIHVIVTGDVDAEARRRLWSDRDSGLRRFEQDWGIKYPEPEWHLIRVEGGPVIEDVLSEADSIAVGDTAVRVVAELCADPATRINASLAGGRKTMSFYIGYALSLFGRAQDELSHVLVSPADFEECEGFWYPMPAVRFPRVEDRLVQDRAGRSHDAALAELTFAAVPFVRLGAYVSKRARPQIAALSFRRVVEEVECALQPTKLVIDCRRPVRVVASGKELCLSPQSFAMLRLVAETRKAERPGAGPEGIGPEYNGWLFADEFAEKDDATVRAFREYLEAALPPLNGRLERFEDGMVGHDVSSLKTAFARVRTRLNDELRRELPLTVIGSYLVDDRIEKDRSTGGRRSRFGLHLRSDQIEL